MGGERVRPETPAERAERRRRERWDDERARADAERAARRAVREAEELAEWRETIRRRGYG